MGRWCGRWAGGAGDGQVVREMGRWCGRWAGGAGDGQVVCEIRTTMGTLLL